VRAAVVIAPYLTNGGYPPLGAAYLNSILRQAGCEVSAFDLQFLLAAENPYLRQTLKEHHHIGRNLHLVDSVLDLRFTLFCLYGEEHPGFRWEVTDDLTDGGAAPWDQREAVRRTFTGLAIRLREQARAHAELVAAASPDLVLLSTYIPNLLCGLLLARALKRLLPATPLLLGGPGTALPDVQRFVLEARLADGIAAGDGELIATTWSRARPAVTSEELSCRTAPAGRTPRAPESASTRLHRSRSSLRAPRRRRPRRCRPGTC
jgi:hypothetical protein